MKLADLLQDDLDRVISFLRKAADPVNKLSLAELKKALELDFVKKYLDRLSTADIICMPSAPPPPEATYPMDAAAGPHKPRMRLSYRDKKVIEDIVLGAIQEASDGLTTHLVVERVHETYPQAQPIFIAQRIRKLEKEGSISGDNKRPKSWFPKPKGQEHPEPMKIKKAAFNLQGP